MSNNSSELSPISVTSAVTLPGRAKDIHFLSESGMLWLRETLKDCMSYLIIYLTQLKKKNYILCQLKSSAYTLTADKFPLQGDTWFLPPSLETKMDPTVRTCTILITGASFLAFYPPWGGDLDRCFLFFSQETWTCLLNTAVGLARKAGMCI